MLKIVTGNQGKFQAAISYLSKYKIVAEQVKLSLIEPQGEDIEEIALFKADQAFSQLKEPIVVMDSGWSITALNGFPGPYMHSLMEWFTLEDLMNLMKGKTDKSIVLQNYACYKDAEQTKIFSRKLVGIIKSEPAGEGNMIDKIVSFRKDLKTIAECDALNLPMADENSDISQWEKLAIWLSSKTK